MPKYPSFEELVLAARRALKGAGKAQTAGLIAARRKEAKAASEAVEGTGVGGARVKYTRMPNAPEYAQELRTRLAMAPGASPEEVSILRELIPDTYSMHRGQYRESIIEGRRYGVPTGLEQWIASDLMRMKMYGDAAFSPSPPLFMDLLRPDERRVAEIARETIFPSMGQKKAAVALLKARFGGQAQALLGTFPLWPSTAQRFTPEIHAKLGELMNFAVADGYAPPRKAVEVLMRAAGIENAGLRAAAAESWWGHLTDTYMANAAALPDSNRGFQGLGAQPMWVYDLATFDKPVSKWGILRAPAALEEFIKKSDRAGGNTRSRFSRQIAEGGVQPAAYITGFLENNREVAGDAVDKWRTFTEGKAKPEAYKLADGELDVMLGELHTPQFEPFLLVKPDPRVGMRGNRQAMTAYMYRMLGPLTRATNEISMVAYKRRSPRNAVNPEAEFAGSGMEEGEGVGGLESPDAGHATLFAKAVAYMRSLFRPDKHFETVLREDVLPYLPPDVQNRYMKAPRELMQELEPFFAKSAFLNNSVSREWTARMVKEARNPQFAPMADDEIGQLVVKGIERFRANHLQTGVKYNRKMMIEDIRQELRTATETNPRLRIMVSNYGLLSNDPATRDQAWRFLDRWMVVPERRGAELPSTAQLGVFTKVLMGLAPSVLLTWLAGQGSQDEYNDADISYRMREEGGGHNFEQSRSYPDLFAERARDKWKNVALAAKMAKNTKPTFTPSFSGVYGRSPEEDGEAT